MKPYAWLTVVLLSLSVVSCGGSSKGEGTDSLTHDSSSGTRSSGATGSGAGMTRAHIYGDYDSDDHFLTGYDDADNDDSSKRKDRDGDSDNGSGSYYDRDDTVRNFGYAASTLDRRAVDIVVKRYFAAAATQDGAAACLMITAPLAKSVPENLGQPPGPPYLRGKTCAVVMSKVFRENRTQLAAYAAQIRVTDVRLSHHRGFAVLDFRTLPGREIRVAREAGAWKIEALVDGELP